MRWLRPDGSPMRQQDWEDSGTLALTLCLDASIAEPVDETGRPQEARSVAWLINGEARMRGFTLPDPGPGRCWAALLDSACHSHGARSRRGHVRMAPHSCFLLESRESESRESQSRGAE